MDTVTRNVDELAPADRAALEHVVGHSLPQDHQIVIAVLGPGDQSDLAREQARARLLKALQRAHQNAAAMGISAEQADTAVAEAMALVRPRTAAS